MVKLVNRIGSVPELGGQTLGVDRPALGLRRESVQERVAIIDAMRDYCPDQTLDDQVKAIRQLALDAMSRRRSGGASGN